MSNEIDPIEIAAKAVVDAMCIRGAGAHDVARAVIAALEGAGWRLIMLNDLDDEAMDRACDAAQDVLGVSERSRQLGLLPRVVNRIVTAYFNAAPTYTHPAEERK